MNIFKKEFYYQSSGKYLVCCEQIEGSASRSLGISRASGFHVTTVSVPDLRAVNRALQKLLLEAKRALALLHLPRPD